MPTKKAAAAAPPPPPAAKPAKAKVVKVPDDLTTLSFGKLADMLLDLRAARQVHEDAANAVKTDELRIKNYLINAMPKAELSKLTGRFAGVSIVKSVVPNVVNWDLFYKYAKKHDAFDLLQKRPSAGAFRERWDAGETIPGVEQFTHIDLSVRKV